MVTPETTTATLIWTTLRRRCVGDSATLMRGDLVWSLGHEPPAKNMSRNWHSIDNRWESEKIVAHVVVRLSKWRG
jgi:hypothetical protein